MRWADGHCEAPPRPDSLPHVRAEMQRFAATNSGVLVEDKPFGAGLHYREAPELEPQARALAERLAQETGLYLQAGKMVFELRVEGHDKGTAITRFMNSAPFHGHRPIFLGDDVTDEDGFEAVVAMGGAGVLIGAERQTHAEYRLEDVGMTLAWLAKAMEVLR